MHEYTNEKHYQKGPGYMSRAEMTFSPVLHEASQPVDGSMG